MVRKDSAGKIAGGLVIGERKIQDAYIVLNINQGELKEDPVCGANLLRHLRGKLDKSKLRGVISTALMRVGIDFNEIKDEIRTIVNKTVI